MKTLKLLFGTACIGISLFMTSCSKKNSDTPVGNSDFASNVTIKLTDGPGHYDAVNIDVKEVQVNTAENGWVSVPAVRPGVYNILKLSNGIDTLLCQATIPSCTINGIRLILGDNNTVEVEGNTYNLNTPSAQETGLKLNLPYTDLKPNTSYMIWFDFDAGKSVVRLGNGTYQLKPVIRAFTSETNGKVKGNVLPITRKAVVYVSNSSESYSAIPDENGNFLISGITEGKYTVRIHPTEGEAVSDVVMTNVEVKYGLITDIGATTFQ